MTTPFHQNTYRKSCEYHIMSYKSDSQLSVRLKLFISFVVVLLMVARVMLPDLKMDAVFLGLLVIALFPWIYPIVESVKLPGGVEMKLGDLKSAGEKVDIQTDTAMKTVSWEIQRPSYLSLVDRDPNLALVGLRIEIEKRLRSLALKHGIRGDQANPLLLRTLKEDHVLSESTASGLQELIEHGNQAAHGGIVEKEVADWAFETGLQILATLDIQLTKGETEDFKDRLEKAITILEFEGAKFIKHCISHLSLAKRDGHVRLHEGKTTTNARAGTTLVKLGALKFKTSYRSFRDYRITAFGEGLLSHLLARYGYSIS